MSCHTWGYKKLEDFTKEEFERIKQDCDKKAEDVLSDTRTAEEINALIKRYHGDNCETLYQTRKRLDIRRKEAEYYKANIDSNPSLIKIYKEGIYQMVGAIAIIFMLVSKLRSLTFRR